MPSQASGSLAFVLRVGLNERNREGEHVILRETSGASAGRFAAMSNKELVDSMTTNHPSLDPTLINGDWLENYMDKEDSILASRISNSIRVSSDCGIEEVIDCISQNSIRALPLGFLIAGRSWLLHCYGGKWRWIFLLSS